jgi:hypothetical protein
MAGKRANVHKVHVSAVEVCVSEGRRESVVRGDKPRARLVELTVSWPARMKVWRYGMDERERDLNQRERAHRHLPLKLGIRHCGLCIAHVGLDWGERDEQHLLKRPSNEEQEKKTHEAA